MRPFTSLALMLLAFSTTVPAQIRPAVADGAGAVRAPASTINSITQNLKKQEGFFTFYTDDKTGKIYLELNQFDKDFLYYTSLTDGVGNGGPERGAASAVLTRFVKMGNKVYLLQPVTNYRAVTSNTDEIRAVENAFARSVLWGFTPVAIEGERVLLDITSFIIRDSQRIGDRLGSGTARGGVPGGGSARPASGGAYKLDETRSAIYLPNTKNFPKNTEFEAMITFTNGAAGGGFGGGGGLAADPSAVTVNMHQSFVELPDNNYKPRKFDPRSGFNLFSYMDFSSPIDEPITKRFSRRHRLAKKDPAAAMSEAIKPIIYYVDRGAPDLVKKALIEGGSWWNQAFEAAGYKNAFQVKELPEGADPMDIRYNIVNWVNRSGTPARAFSYGSSYIDPRTGEIIKGAVTLGSDRHRQDYLIAEGLLQPYEDGKPVSKKMQEMAYARVRQLSAHEIGHTLGLYHNFAASVKDRASVMDYPFPRFSLKADGTVDLTDAYAKGIGTWDKRSIIWGYSDFGKGDEEAGLDKIMKETLKQGFVFIPDIGGNVHPLAHQWDDGADAVTQLNNIMTVRRKVLDNFSEKAIMANAPMSTLEEVLVPIYLLHRYQVEGVANSLGGLFFTHALKNDGQTVTKMIDPAEQWRSFEALMTTITPEALALPEALIAKIPPRPSGYQASVETFSGHTGVTFDPIAAAEAAADNTISFLLDPERAARLIEYHSRDEKQPGFMVIVDKIFEKTWKLARPVGYKGELQSVVNNLVLKNLLELAASPRTGENVRGEAMLKIEELKDWMTAAKASATPALKANILFALSQIEAFKKDPDKFIPPPPLEMPPGAPIGMPGLLDDDLVF
ncbi:MAG: zinc-dependent metalloprotease [Chitinophagaceae bacterium]